MGLKWFRARLTMNRKSKGSPRQQPEFYRSMSQFDSDLQFPDQQSSASRENHIRPSIHSAPTSPSSLAYNPLATTNGQQNESSASREDNVPKPRPRREWQASSDEESGSPDDAIAIPRHLPRESIEMMRGGSDEASPRQITKSRKADFKKKKAKAPIPNARSGSFHERPSPASVDKGRSSDGSEIEI